MMEVARFIFLYVVPCFICLTLIGFIVKTVYARVQNREKYLEKKQNKSNMK